MIHKYINKDHLLAVQRAVEGLSSVTVLFCDGNGMQLLASENQDPVVSLLTGTDPGREEYLGFVTETVRTAVSRKDVTLSRSPFAQYHFFIPCHMEDASLVLVAGSFYLSEDEFPEFIGREGYRYNLSFDQIEKVSKQIRILDYEKIKKLAEDIRQCYCLTLRNVAENTQLKKKYSRTKTIVRLLSNMGGQSSEAQFHEFFSEMLIFLFHVETLSLMAQRGEHFESVFSAGRYKGPLASVRFSRSNRTISETLQKRQPSFCNDPAHIRDLGLAEEIETFRIFPCFEKNGDCLLLCLYNTELNSEEEEEIAEVFQFISTMVTTVSVKDSYDTRIKEMAELNLATSGLDLAFNEPEFLYSSIVDTAVRLSKAEKGSLFLAENDPEELSIKAVYGVNKWLLKDLKIRSGEGIAGKVFQESIPVISKDIEKDFSIRSKPSYKTPSFMSIPLKVGDETIGVLNVSDKITGEVFHEEDLALVHHFANYASIALKGSTYYSLAEHMKELSITDPLTDLYNLRYFRERLAEEIDRSERHNLNSSLCIIDIDDFKLFNDTEGHPAGDDLLIRLSRLVHDSLRAIDVLARVGGEEFAVIMPQTDRNEAFLAAERIRNMVRQKLDRTWKQYPKERVTVSIGVSTFPVDGTEVKRLISNADKALYGAKMHGKDKTFAWEEHSSF